MEKKMTFSNVPYPSSVHPHICCQSGWGKLFCCCALNSPVTSLGDPLLHTKAICLYSFLISSPVFYLSYSLFSCFSTVRRFMLSPGKLFTGLLDSLPLRAEHSCAVERLCMKEDAVPMHKDEKKLHTWRDADLPWDFHTTDIHSQWIRFA